MAALLLLVVFASAADTARGPGIAQPPSSVVETSAAGTSTVLGSSAQYPRDDLFVRLWAQVNFEDLSQGGLRLAEGSPFRRAGLDGTAAASTTTCSRDRPSRRR